MLSYMKPIGVALSLALATGASAQDMTSFNEFSMGEAATSGLTALSSTIDALDLSDGAPTAAAYTKDGQSVSCNRSANVSQNAIDTCPPGGSGTARMRYSVPNVGLVNSDLAFGGSAGSGLMTNLVVPILFSRERATSGVVDKGSESSDSIAVPSALKTRYGMLFMAGKAGLEMDLANLSGTGAAAKINTMDLDRVGLGGFVGRKFAGDRGSLVFGSTLGLLRGNATSDTAVKHKVEAVELMAVADLKYRVAKIGPFEIGLSAKTDYSLVDGSSVAAGAAKAKFDTSMTKAAAGVEMKMALPVGELKFEVGAAAAADSAMTLVGECVKSKTGTTCQELAPYAKPAPVLKVGFTNERVGVSVSTIGLGTAREEVQAKASFKMRF